MVESFTKSMQGTKPKADDVKALIAYLDTLEYPKNPFRKPDGGLTPGRPARPGRLPIAPRPPATPATAAPSSPTARIHEVGLEERDDAYRGYNPPSLRGVYDKDPYLHDGRAKTLREALSGPHSAENVTGLGEISDQELDDLIAYLKTL